MQTNTIGAGDRAVNLSSPSVEKEAYRTDPFTFRDGRYVGSDGFVVPKDFREFFERFPNYVRQWVGKHGGTSAPEEDLEDWTQDLLMHLSSLPRTSKYREAGKEDIVATFDPLRHYGANEARFRNYINLCLANKFRTMQSKRTKDALCRTGNLSLDVEMRDQAGCADDEYCHTHSARLQAATKAAEKQGGDRVFLREFCRFARREDANVLPAIRALMATGSGSEAAYWLGIGELEFDRMRTRVRHLARCFVSGEPLPKQRKPYKQRREPSACELVG
jgi:hypothetical protein